MFIAADIFSLTMSVITTPTSGQEAGCSSTQVHLNMDDLFMVPFILFNLL